jgi:hypothetical protein
VSTESVGPELSAAIVFSDGMIREAGTGKVTLIGSFQILNAASFPFAGAPFFVTAFVEHLPLGVQLLARASLISSDGSELGGSAGQLKIDGVVEPGAHIEIPFPMPAITFQAAGAYPIRILIGDQEIGRKTLFLRSAPQFPIYLPPVPIG